MISVAVAVVAVVAVVDDDDVGGGGAVTARPQCPMQLRPPPDACCEAPRPWRIFR